jgi:two-component system response regulator GlrR
MPRKPTKKSEQPIIQEQIRPLRILLVDDDPFILTMVSAWLEAEAYEVKTTENGSDAINSLADFDPHLVITDLRMEGMDGIALLKEIQNYNSILPVIMLSGAAEISDAVSATHQGIFEFLTKPITPEPLFNSIKNALNHVSIGEQETDFAPEIIHQSQIMVKLLKQAQRVAKTGSSVFIGGATGTGKELLARAIHQASPRSEEVFLDINCGALSEQLLESELFGHEKGAFTGAVRKNLGLFQAANGGTLFLDEVGDMPATLQVKLLRVLQEGKVKPVGAIESVDVDVRIISATHHDLELAVKRGEFREDLFYRLNVIPLFMSPLKDRDNDIVLLIDYFLTIQSKKEGIEATRFSPEALEYLKSLAWPGNVRQLQNVIEQCSVLSASPVIPEVLVQRALRETEKQLPTLIEARNESDYIYINRLLRMFEGDIIQSANVAGCEMIEFEDLLNQHKIDPKKFHKSPEEIAPEGDEIRTY